MSGLQAFEKQQYLNIETMRKNGQGVKTPVWFAQKGESLFIWTESGSGKARRIRNFPQVQVAPSRADGTPVGDWVAATAQVDGSAAAVEHVRVLMQQKSGLMFSMFALMGKLRKSKYTSIRVELAGR